MSTDPRPYSRPSRSSPAGIGRPRGAVGDADRVHVGVEQHARPVAAAERADDVAELVDLDGVAQPLHLLAHERRHRALLAGRARGADEAAREAHQGVDVHGGIMPAPAGGGYATPVNAPVTSIWRRRLTALGVLAAVLVVAALLLGNGEDSDNQEPASSAQEPPAPPELPRGGRSVLPEHRVVAYYGAPQSRELGALGIGTPRGAARRLAREARRYRRDDRAELPALELIAVIANADPGDDGMYRDARPTR